MSSINVNCTICGGALESVPNPFCEMQAQLLSPGAKVEQSVCTVCEHGLLHHDVPLELLYNASVALPTEYVNSDIRFAFVASHLDLRSITGTVVEFGGGPGELAEQAMQAIGKQRATVVDFVNRVSSDSLDFIALDFNSEIARIESIFAETASEKNLFLLSHVIEHLYDPSLLLRQLAKFSNSVTYVEVPDFSAVHHKSTLQFALNCLDHLHYFTGQSFLNLLQQAGFDILAFEKQSAPRMPALRALCAPARRHNAVRDHQAHYADIAEQFRQKIANAAPGVQVWIWGLSAFMAQALNDLGKDRERVAGIFDTRYPHGEFLGIPVQKEPGLDAASSEGKRNLIVCGSTYSAVQKVIGTKAKSAFAGAEFFAIST